MNSKLDHHKIHQTGDEIVTVYKQIWSTIFQRILHIMRGIEMRCYRHIVAPGMLCMMIGNGIGNVRYDAMMVGRDMSSIVVVSLVMG